jgi:hypothetical protein
MKGLLAAAAVLFATTGAAAAPGDPVRVQGRVLSQDSTTVVVQSPGGQIYYGDTRPLSEAQKIRGLQPGEMVTLIGAEGTRPGEIDVVGIERAATGGDAAPGAALLR